MNLNLAFQAKKMVSQVVVFTIFTTLFLVPFAQAQVTTIPPEEIDTGSPPPGAPGDIPLQENATGNESELSSCFDYYRFGSVPVVFSGDVNTASQGSTMTFTGTITNENEYPILNAAVYVKMLLNRTEQKTSFGPEIVDWFTAVKNINLKAGESKEVSFAWDVPKSAEPGNYKMATYVASNDRFNLFGLSFTNDIVGGAFNFKIVGEKMGSTHIETESIILGDETYRAAAFSPRLEATENRVVPVSVSIANTSSKDFSGMVVWKLYSWDGLQEEKVSQSTITDVSIKAKSNTKLSFSVTDESESVYFITAELIPNDPTAPKSFINVRVVDTVVSTPRLNFLGVSKYPASGSTLFACVHATGRTKADNVRVEISARSFSPAGNKELGEVFAQKTYEGSIPGALSAITLPLEHAPSSFILEARVFQDDVLIDHLEIPYRCNELGIECDSKSVIDTQMPSNISTLQFISIVITILALLLIAVLQLIKVRKRKNDTPNTTTI